MKNTPCTPQAAHPNHAEQSSAEGCRIEADALGSVSLPADALYGIHAARASENFAISGYRLPTVLIRSIAEVKLAWVRTNFLIQAFDAGIARALELACKEVIEGKHHDAIIVDAFQGGAGTSANMNMNEILANRAMQLYGQCQPVEDERAVSGGSADATAASAAEGVQRETKDFESLLGGAEQAEVLEHGCVVIDPVRHANLHQSTNDVFPTAVKVAVLHELTRLEPLIANLQELLQHKEQEYADVLRLSRTQLQDAVPITAGMTFGAWAEAVARDRWRVFKCRERIRQVNLGGTAVGTGLGAPREGIFRVVEELRRITGLKIARAENLVDATQNLDAFVEVSGMLKACAANLFKISQDIRLLSSGPRAGFGELRIPAVQAGSSIMPGKVNPVIPEAVSQAALRVMANDSLVGQVAALGTLELNQYMPLMAHVMLESLQLLCGAVEALHVKCLQAAEPDVEMCMQHATASNALATVLVPAFGYSRVEQFLREAGELGVSLADVVAQQCNVSVEAVEELLTPKRMRQLGYTKETYAELLNPERDSK